MNAMKPESVMNQEQTLVVIDAGDCEISYKQICRAAGAADCPARETGRPGGAVDSEWG